MTNSSYDLREAKIIYQNQSHLAFEIIKYNQSVSDATEPIKPADVVASALKLTKVVLTIDVHLSKEIPK